MAMSLEYNPPCYFWIAHYMDGQALPQFDPEDGHENLFSKIDQSKLLKFGLYPYTQKMAAAIKSIHVLVSPFLSPIELALKPSQRLICFRENKIHTGTYRVCLKCQAAWQQQKKPGVMAFPISFLWFNDYTEDKDGKRKPFQMAVCPKCGEHNSLHCPHCGGDRTKWAKCPKCGGKVENQTCLKCRTCFPSYPHSPLSPPIPFPSDSAFEYMYLCSGCGRDLHDLVKIRHFEKRATTYGLGWQETVAGKNRKVLLRVSENGSVDVEGTAA